MTKVFLDGKEVPNALRVDIITGTGTPPPDPIPDPKPEPAPIGCGPVPNRVVLSGEIDLANAGSQRSMDLGAETRALRFTMTAAPSAVQFAFANKVGTLGVQRTAWVSRCPGGEPVMGSVATGTENTSVRVSSTARRGYALLTAGTTYYLNIRNGASTTPGDPTTCATGDCGVYLMTYAG